MGVSIAASTVKKTTEDQKTGASSQPAGPAASPAGGGYDAQREALKPGGGGLKSQLSRVQITAGKLHVRSSPEVKPGNHLGYLKRDDVVTVRGHAAGGWLEIEFNGADNAFISGKWAKPAGGGPGVGVAGGSADKLATAKAQGGAGGGTADVEKPVTETSHVEVEGKAAKAPAKTPDKKPEDAVPSKGSKANRMEVTSSTLNVRSSPVVNKTNKLGQLRKGDTVEVLGVADGWAAIVFKGADKAFVSAKYLSKPEPKQTAKSVAAANEKYGSIVSQLAADFQNVPVWNPGQAVTEKPAGTFKTPYVLNVGAAVSGLSKEYTTHKGLSARAGGTVAKHTGHRPFIGKGTPKEVQIVAQAAIDAGKTTVSGIQAYINNGPWNDRRNRKNGRWGVDCSGLTVIAINEMAGNGRSVKGNISAKSYRPGGAAVKSKGFHQVTGDNAQAGDVVSYMSTNHVMVIHSRVDTTIKDAAGKGETVPAILLKMAESTASKKAGHRGPQTARVMWYVPGAKSYMGRTARTSPDVTLANRQDSGKHRPTWKKSKGRLLVVGKGFSKGNFSIVRPKNNKVLDGELDQGEKKTNQPKQ